MSAEVILFAGTSDGRALGEALAENNIQVLVCVATEYGEQLVKETAHLRVHQGRLTQQQMEALLRREGCSLVVDATHPFAQEVSANIRAACDGAGAQYLRMLRDQEDCEGAVWAQDMEQAADILSQDSSPILLTVGSKELVAFTKVKDYQSRVFPRVLPMVEALEKCGQLGFAPANLICMQGPFSHEMNVATLRQIKAGWLVTKDSGAAGGMAEKSSAARAAGARLLVIRRPQEEGLSASQLHRELEKRFEIRLSTVKEASPAPRFPLFVDLQGKPVAVVGGGKIATRRVKTLLRCGAEVQVIAPEITQELRALHREGVIRWKQREYEEGDLEGIFLSTACTDSPQVNGLVCREAQQRGIQCSAAHDREKGSYWFPALLQSGNLAVGMVSIDGDHAAVRHAADKIRRYLGDSE